MQKKLGRAAAIGGIAVVLSSFFGIAVSTLIVQLGVYSAKYYAASSLFVILSIVETVAAMLAAVKIGCKLIGPCHVKAPNCLLVALGAGVVEPIALSFLRLPSPVNYVVSFLIFAVFALLVKAEPIEAPAQQAPVAPKPAVAANEEMSAKAQYAYNTKLNALLETAVTVDEMTEAKLFAQAVELQLLKAPATAQFCALEEMTVTVNNGQYVVSGYVDSQNSYGAMVRTPFTVTVFKQDGAWKNADRFISTNAVIGKQVLSNTLLYWVIGIILSLASFAFFYFTISSRLGL